MYSHYAWKAHGLNFADMNLDVCFFGTLRVKICYAQEVCFVLNLMLCITLSKSSKITGSHVIVLIKCDPEMYLGTSLRYGISHQI